MARRLLPPPLCLAMAHPPLALDQRALYRGLVRDRRIHRPPATRARRRGLQALRHGPHARDTLRFRVRVSDQFPVAHLLVLDGEQLRALGLPVHLAHGLVAGSHPAGPRLPEPPARARAPRPQRAGRAVLYNLRHRAGMVADSDRPGALFRNQSRRLLGPPGGLGAATVRRIVPHAPMASHVLMALVGCCHCSADRTARTYGITCSHGSSWCSPSCISMSCCLIPTSIRTG